MSANEKFKKLTENLYKLGSVAVAFSAGVDSTLLTYAAAKALGKRAVAITAVSPLVPEREISEARAFCRESGIKLIEVPADDILDIIKENPKDRCYICKRAIMGKIIAAAKERGVCVVAEGSNADDSRDYRPGERAIAELGIISPLKEAGLTKAEIREIAKAECLSCWDKPAYACLATRFPTGDSLTPEKIKAVEKAEDYLHLLGFLQVRVRTHKDLARIEISDTDFEKILSKKLLNEISERLKSFGFRYVSLDMSGYKTGNMN